MAKEYNMLYKHADGNNLILENTADDKIEKMNLNAETVVDNLVAAGKNILDPFTDFHPEFDGLSSTITEDGYITVTGIPKYDYVSIVGFTNLTDILEDGATYTLSMTDNNSYVWCEVTAVQNGSSKAWYSSRNNASFTVDKSTYQYRVRILTTTVSAWGSSSRTITSAFQLEKGSKTSYEPFSFATREPSPTNPTEIKVLEKDVNVRFTTRNLLGKKTGTYVNNGITFTANEDGSITANGTASANANWYFYSWNYEQPELPNGVYTISGCPFGGSASTYYFRVIKKDGVGALTYWQDFGSGRDFTIESDSTIACHIHIESGQTVNNLTFYPQITIKGTRNLLNLSTTEVGKAWNNASNSGRAVIYAQVQPNTTYTVSFKSKNGADALYYFEKANKTDSTATVATTGINFSLTKTTSSTTNYIGIQINKSGVTLDDIKGMDIILENGDTIHDYIPGYTPGNQQNIELNFGVDNLWEFIEDNFYEVGNATYEIIDHNTLKVTTTSSGTYRNVKFKLDIPDGTYTFSLGSVSNTNTNMTFKRMSLSTYTNGTRAVVQHIDQGTPKAVNITNASGKQYVLEFWASYNTSIENEATFSNIQVEKGSVAHSFSDYNDTPIFLGTLNDLKNKIYYKDGKWYYSQEIQKYQFTGNETINSLSNYRWQTRIPNSSADGWSNIISMCNSLESVSQSITGSTTKTNIIAVNGVWAYIILDSTTTLNTYKQFLQDNDVIIYYQLATPSVTEITNETLLTQLNILRNAVTYDDYTTVKFLDGATKEILKSGLISFDYSLNNSNEYFQALIDNTATIETIVNVLPLNEEEETINLNEENSVINWIHSDFRYVQNTEDKSQAGFIGQFVARTFDGKVIDLDDDFNIENHEIEVYLGIVNEEDTGYISLGNFIIESIERDEVDDTTSFKSSDYTLLFNQKFDGDYTDDNFTQSFNERIQNGETVTALWLAQYTCAQVGVVLGHTDFTNYDYVIASNQFDDQHTCRDVIKSIAKLAYSWARIGWDNKLYFDFTVDTEVNTDLNIITNENYYNLETQKEEIGEINKVILGSSIVSGNNQYIEDSASIEANGEHAIEIYDNPITYNDDTKIAALENGDVLYGLHYRPLSTLTTGHPWLQGNELIEIIDMEGNSIYTYPFDRVIEYNGHIKTKLDSYGATEVEATYTYEGTDNVNRQTKVELDRQNQRLTVAISELTGEIQDVSDEFNTLVEPSKTVSGNPIQISDAGEYILKKFGLYGHSEQDGTGSIDEPSEVTSVTGEHTLILRSKNMFRALPTSTTKSGVTMNIQNNIISLNGTATGGEYFEINNYREEEESENDYLTLQPGTYTITGIIDGLPEGDLPTILLVDWGGSSMDVSPLSYAGWIQTEDSFVQTVTFTINEVAPKACFRLSTNTNGTYNISSIKLQLEKGSESTSYGQYIEPQEFIYDLGDMELRSIGTLKDSITYNITDEKWYVNKNIGYFVSVDGWGYNNADGKNCTQVYLYDELYDAEADSQHGIFSDSELRFPIENILSDKLAYKGITTRTSFPDEEGFYIWQDDQIPGQPFSSTYGTHYVILKSRLNATPATYINPQQVSTWAQSEPIKIYYQLAQQITEELTDYDLVVQLNEILEKAKTYPTYMVIEDFANVSGTETELEITYMLDTEFNGNYATRTELQVTQNSISTVVADTVSTTLDPITLGLEDLGDRINTVEGNLQGDIDELRGDLGDYALQTDVVTLERSVTELQTSTAEVISVAKSIQLNGIERVRTSTDYTFDENGLSIGKTGAATKTQVTENGMSIYSTAGSTDEAMLTVNSQGVDAYNVKVGTYLLIGSHARMQDYEDGTGVFYIG